MRPILVVDDEFDISEVIGSILRADGYTVDVCANGRDAIEYFRSHPPPALVILDVMMPFVSGFEVLRHLKAAEATREVPVVLMSAVQPTVKQEDFGWSAFLRKPFNLDTLVELVARYAGAPAVEESA